MGLRRKLPVLCDLECAEPQLTFDAAGGGEECLIYIKSDERGTILRRKNSPPLGVASSPKKNGPPYTGKHGGP